jgi:putative tricarboxylic transport membrane protein
MEGAALEGLQLALSPAGVIAAVFGLILGLIFGAIPGLTATLGVALLVPVTFVLDPVPGMIMLSGVYAGAIYAGSITGILLRIPGTPASIPTMWDGHALTLQGKPRLALGTAALASGIGGLVSGVVLMTLSPVLAGVALRFGSAEYVAIVVFGLVVVACLLGGSVLHSTVGVLVGLAMGLVGLDPMEGFSRFSIGQYQLAGGLDVVPVLVGMFALTEAVRMASSSLRRYQPGDTSALQPGKRLPDFGVLRRNVWNLTRSSSLGVMLGLLPAVGPETTPFISYAAARRKAKNRKMFGKGALEGIISAEASNNANVGGSLIPLLTLGIPGSAVAAVFLGALTLKGLQPGPLLFVDQPVIMYGLFAGFLLVNLIMLFAGVLFVRQFAVVLRLPNALLASAVAFFSIVGAFSIGSNIFNVWVMFGAVLLTAALLTAKIPLAPVVLGLILGPLLEQNLTRALRISQGDWTVFLTRPISLAFFVLSVAVIVAARFTNIRGDQIVERTTEDTEDDEAAGVARD